MSIREIRNVLGFILLGMVLTGALFGWHFDLNVCHIAGGVTGFIYAIYYKLHKASFNKL